MEELSGDFWAVGLKISMVLSRFVAERGLEGGLLCTTADGLYENSNIENLYS